MDQILIERPHNLSLIYFVTDEVYENVLQSASRYSYTGLGMWNQLSKNFIISHVELGTITTILANMGALQSTSFADIYDFIMGKSQIDAIGVDEDPIRDWPKVYSDLVAAGMRNREHNGENAVDWVLDGVIINKEPQPATAL
jgi:hypothetical protein